MWGRDQFEVDRSVVGPGLRLTPGGVQLVGVLLPSLNHVTAWENALPTTDGLYVTTPPYGA